MWARPIRKTYLSSPATRWLRDRFMLPQHSFIHLSCYHHGVCRYLCQGNRMMRIEFAIWASTLSFFFTDLKCRIFADFFFSNWLHESKRNYPGNSPCGFLLQQGHFASIGNESIMIHSLKWGCCHLADTAQLEGCGYMGTTGS